MACEEEPSRRRFGGLQGKTPSPQMNASNKNDPLETRKREIKPMIWRRTSRRVFHSSSCGIFSPRLTLARRRRACAHTPRNVEAPPAAAVAGRRNSLHGEPHSFLLAIPSLRVAPFLTNPAGNARKTRSHERVFHSSSCGIPSPRLTLARRRRMLKY